MRISILLCGCGLLWLWACRSEEVSQRDLQSFVLEKDLGEAILGTWIPDYDTSRWTELIRADSSLVLDLRYATSDNFVGEVMYDCGRCFLRPQAAQSLLQIQDSLATLGLGLKLFDCYRPLPVQWRLWNKVPDRRYVADPRKGSQHNKGVAVDLTLVELTSGEELDMGTDYDYFGGEAWHRATSGFPQPIRGHREKLLSLMEGHGWKRTNSEWWHYSYPLSKTLAPLDSMLWRCDAPALPAQTNSL